MVKTVAIAFNTDDTNSIWYKKNDYAMLSAQIGHSARAGETPYYTRLYREIAMRVVDGSTMKDVAIGSGGYDFMLREKERKRRRAASRSDLFAERRNYFKFIPTYSGEYRVTFDTDDDYEVFLNDTPAAITNHSCKWSLLKNVSYQIEIRSRESRTSRFALSAEPYGQTELSIASNDLYLVKINGSGGKSIESGNPEVKIKSLLVLSDGILTDMQAIKTSTTVYQGIFEEDKDYYLVLENKSDTVQTTALDILELSSLSSETILEQQTIDPNGKVYSFITPESGYYTLALSGSGYELDFALSDGKACPAEQFIGEEKYARYYLVESNTVYIEIRSTDGIKTDVQVCVKPADTAVEWYAKDNSVKNSQSNGFRVRYYRSDAETARNFTA